jgi:phospholipase C
MRFVRSPRRVTAGGITRRRALQQIGAAAGAAAVAPWLKGCSETETAFVAAPLRPEELDIETVIFVMMENRSFDHYFGSLSLAEGRAVDGLTAALSNPRPDGSPVAPFPMDLRCVADPPHGWTRSRRQFNDGANDGFVQQHYEGIVEDGLPVEVADQVMGYAMRTDLPFMYALADEFVLCERWFCSVMGPTWPNRFYLHSAQSNGRINNDFPDDIVTGFTWPSIYDRLNAAGIEWKDYYSDLSFLFLWGRLREQTQRFATIPQFIDDARSGRLPPVCHVQPLYFGPAGNDDHPPHDIARGQVFLSTILRALAEGPQWSRSLLILTYDEHGGFYDHVPPPTVDDERSADGFGQLGFRIPSLVISPYAQRGFASPTLYEHSSVPAFIEWLFGLEPLTVRDAQANYFLDTFDLDRVRRHDPRPLPQLPIVDVDPDVAPECLPFEGGGAGDELAQLADVGGIPAHLDRRRNGPDLLRTINRELIALGGARSVRT